MQKLLKVKINIEDSNPKNCKIDCHYLDTFYDECKLFNKKLCGKSNPEIWFRCVECLNQEIKDEA